jgi:MFS transporter, ACDE family, multidrug resistance protein
MKNAEIYKNRNFQIATAANFLGFMMVVLVSPAFPTMVAQLHVPEVSVGLLITVVTLPALVLIPVCGMLSDRFGRKVVLIPAVIIYGAAGGCCAFAQDFNTLLILRFIQGIGIAPIFNLNTVIVCDIFSGNQRAEAMGINTTISYIGYILYPVLGGFLASLGWQYTFLPFFLAVPLGIYALFYLKYPEPRNRQDFGVYLKTSFAYMKNIKVIWLFAGAILVYIVFFGGFLDYFTLMMGSRFQASPVVLGTMIAVLGLVVAVVCLLAGRINSRFHPAGVIVAAFIIYAAGMFIMPLMPGIWWCLLPTLVIGIAHGLVSPSMPLFASHVTPAEYRAGFISIFGLMFNVGMTTAPLLAGLAYTATGQSFDMTFVILGIVSLVIPVAAIAIGGKKLPLK